MAEPMALNDQCMHPGAHSSPNRCPDCARFSSHSYDTGAFYTQNGFQQRWGGVCKIHGEWEDSAA